MQTKFLALKKMRQINSLNCLKCTKSSLKLSHACQLKSQGKKCTTNLTPPSIFNSCLKVLSLSGPFPCMVLNLVDSEHFFSLHFWNSLLVWPMFCLPDIVHSEQFRSNLLVFSFPLSSFVCTRRRTR